MTTVKILPDLNALVDESSEYIATKMKDAVAKNGVCYIALAGGSTPEPVYEKLAKADLPWDKIHFFWGDERYVPPTHEDSNYKMSKEAWLDSIDIPESNIHITPTEGSDVQSDAQEYEQDILDTFGITEGIPTFDVVFMGMGDDGHTASLFPETYALSVVDRLVTVGNKQEHQRITFTIPLINNADCVVFLVAGEGKQSALAQVFNDEDNSYQYPSKLIQPQGELVWFLDEAVAKQLEVD